MDGRIAQTETVGDVVVSSCPRAARTKALAVEACVMFSALTCRVLKIVRRRNRP